MTQILDDVEQQQRYWENLVERIRAGEAAGTREFRATYRPGIRFLLQRRIGDARIDEVVDDTLDTVLHEMHCGRLSTVAEMARIIRKAMPKTVTGPTETVERELGTTRTELLDRALERFSHTEREVLVAYYVRSVSEREVEAEYGYDAVAFRHLRERLVRSFHAVRTRKGAGSVRALAADAGASAVSGGRVNH
jgi:hypothetical protein